MFILVSSLSCHIHIHLTSILISVKLVFYYGNRCPNALKDVTAELPENDAYKIQARPNEPFEVAPKKQVLHYFLLHCFKPFKFPIVVKIKFNYLGK